MQTTLWPATLTPDEVERLNIPTLSVVPGGDVAVMDPQGAKLMESVRAVRHSERHVVQLNRVGHPELAVFRRAGAPDRAATEHRIYDVMSTYIMDFLKATLHQDASAQAFLRRTPEANGIPAGLVTADVMPALGGLTEEAQHRAVCCES